MPELSDLIAEDALKEMRLPDDAVLNRLAELSTKQIALEAEVEMLESKLKETNERLTEVRDRELSDLLLEYGLREIKLRNGKRVSVKEMIYASLKKEAKEEGVKWLEANGFGGIVKSSVILDAGKGNKASLAEIKDAAARAGVPYKEKDEIHPMTLSAFVKEQRERGTPVPESFFSVFVVNRTKID